MTYPALLEHFAHHCRLAQRVRNLTAELRDLRTSYESMTAAYYEARGELDLYADKPNYRTALLCLDTANQREAALQTALAQVEEFASQMQAERDDARREVDEVRAALVWLERDFKVGGAA